MSNDVVHVSTIREPEKYRSLAFYPPDDVPRAHPLFVYLTINLAEKPSARSKVRVHELPVDAIFVYNQLTPRISNCWAITQSVGPFWSTRGAHLFATAWRSNTRRSEWLIAKGLMLIHATPYTQDLVMRVTGLTAQEHTAKLRGRHTVYEPDVGPPMCLHPHHRRKQYGSVTEASPHVSCVHETYPNYLDAHSHITPGRSAATTLGDADSLVSHVRVQDMFESWLRPEHVLAFADVTDYPTEEDVPTHESAIVIV